jgi:hypothetical protein
MDTLTPAFTGSPAPSPAPTRGQRLSVYADERTLELLAPWGSGRLRSARLAAIVERYDTLANSRRPELDLHQWNVVLQLLPALSAWRDAARLWAEVADRHREHRPLPGVDGEQLAARLHALAAPELLALLEVADRAGLAQGSVRERLAAVGARIRP